MGAVLRTSVHVTDANNVVTVLAAGSEVPDDLAEFVTNPKAYVNVPEAEPDIETDDDSVPEPTLEELKDELRRRELPVSGTKAELLGRIAADDAEKE